MTRKRSAKEKQKISQGLKEYWRSKGKSHAKKLGTTLAIGGAAIYGAKKGTPAVKRFASKKIGAIDEKLGAYLKKNIYDSVTGQATSVNPVVDAALNSKTVRGAREGLAEGVRDRITADKEKVVSTVKNTVDSVSTTPRKTVEAFRRGADSTQAISVNDPHYKRGRALGKVYKRIKKRARDDRKKLGFNYNSLEYIEFKAGLTKAAVKVGAHMRDGKWITGFKQTRNLAKQAPKAAKALNVASAVSNPKKYVKQKAAVEVARRGGLELSKKSSNKFVKTGELPSRNEILNNASGLLRNPRAKIVRGLQRESAILKELSNELGPPPITRGIVIRKTLEPAKNHFVGQVKQFKENPSLFLQSELARTKELATSEMAENLYINSGGLVGSLLGSHAGPGGGIAGDLIGARTARRGLTDTKAMVAAVRNRKNLPKLEPEFGVSPRVQRFGQIIEDAKSRVDQEIRDTGRAGVADDVGGWALGNAVGEVLLAGSVPGAGVLPGVAGSMYAQAVEKRMTQTGEDLLTASSNYIRDKIKTGNIREQKLRDQIRERWNRLLYLEAK